MDTDKTTALITFDEGYETHAYMDTVNRWSIGVGRNIDPRGGKGLRRCEVDFMLANDIAEADEALRRAYEFYECMSDVRKAVMISMYHNLGPTRLSKFKKTIKFLVKYDYESASEEMLDSKWATQVGYRAYRLSQMMLTNEWPESFRSTQ